MAQERLNRDEFFDLLAGMDDEALKKILWTLYWRGARPVRERIEDLVGVPAPPPTPTTPDPVFVLQDVKDFAALARAGAYMGGDRRVSPKERTRWRFTFRDLTGQALQALNSDDEESVRAGASALAVMIDLAMETRGVDYFRSEDPLEAARFVVSDVVRALWLRTRMVYGSSVFAEQACRQLLRWESGHGWTRRGDGWVAARETPLAHVAEELLVTPDMWNEFAEKYVETLDRAAADTGGGGRGSRPVRRASYQDLSQWHSILDERLVGSDREELLDRLPSRRAAGGS